MELIKKVPAHTKKITIRWCKPDFTRMTPRFREIRAGAKNKMDRCFWCRHQFEDGEMMALAALEKGPNKTLCQKCAAELLTSEKNRETSLDTDSAKG